MFIASYSLCSALYQLHHPKLLYVSYRQIPFDGDYARAIVGCLNCLQQPKCGVLSLSCTRP